ncbi:DUF6161 domain-containing protein [Flavobacterium noncentrifugens]|uniref:DUF6161 domain-containing protein n=1 Tax=Flavobacterium noncentrifugens TaxID=1128970 RepID=A0A1G8Y1V9_9FLAO|nr:DUF6161 domain-containing protein [Flavobacterium noncentrifugens]SDJ96792.1 hypothetical protein SAMN04487935_2158 [Flavobacterium noncentrifugens]
MKNSDFRKLVNSIPNESILRNHVYNLVIPSEEYEAGYDLIGLHKFVLEKSTKWQHSDASPEFAQSLSYFNNLLDAIEKSVDTNINLSDGTRHHSIITSLNRVNNNIFLPDSARILFLRHIYSNSRKYFKGALAVVAKSLEYGQMSNVDYFNGAFLASKFETQEVDSLSREEAEEKSLSQIKTEFDIERTEKLSEFESIVTSTEEKANLEIENLKGLFDAWNVEYGSQMEDLKTAANSEINKSNALGKKLLKKSLTKKMQLEQTYRENMRFQAPAEYWRERATTLNAEGKSFMLWLIALVGVGVLILFWLLWLTPENMLESIFSGSPAKAIRWSIIFITLISLLFVGVQAVKKAMFSSYHLARDAEEREKLTVFYLSLIKDSTITQEDRSLILQALFSRADTGMLKDDSSPTMPGIFDKFKG